MPLRMAPVNLELLGREVLVLVALPVVRDARTRRFLGVLLLVLVTIYALNDALHLSHIFSRYLIFITFALQLSVVAALSAVRRQRLGRLVLPAFVLIAALGGARQLRIAALTMPRPTNLAFSTSATISPRIVSSATDITVKRSVL